MPELMSNREASAAGAGTFIYKNDAVLFLSIHQQAAFERFRFKRGDLIDTELLSYAFNWDGILKVWFGFKNSRHQPIRRSSSF